LFIATYSNFTGATYCYRPNRLYIRILFFPECSELDIEDIDFTSKQISEKKISFGATDGMPNCIPIHVWKSKNSKSHNDGCGEGVLLTLRAFSERRVCGCVMLSLWLTILRANGITSGPLFPCFGDDSDNPRFQPDSRWKGTQFNTAFGDLMEAMARTKIQPNAFQNGNWTTHTCR
jgi:hypothetical protein